ncbi:MAG: type I secretion system permease/ATPase [Pseudomonadota bacterium]
MDERESGFKDHAPPTAQNPVGDLVNRIETEAISFGATEGLSGAIDGKPSGDPTVLALLDVAAHYGFQATPLTITAGLALVNGRLPLEHINDAARRCNLDAQVDEFDLKSSTGYELPAVLFTHENEPEILWAWQESPNSSARLAIVSLPGGERIEIPETELSEAYQKRVLRLRPAINADQRGLELGNGPDRNWFFSAFADSRRIYAEAILATIAINFLALAMPLFAMNIYDRVLPNAAEATLLALAIGVLLATAFDFILRTLRGHFVDAASRRADVRLSALIFSRLLGGRLNPQPGSTGVKANTLREFETLREFFNSATLAAFGDLPFLFLFVVVIWIVAGPLAFIVLAAIPIVLFCGWLTQRALRRRVLAAFQQTAQKNAVAVESLIGHETIKTAGAESWLAAKWESSVAEHVRTGIGIRHLSNLGQHFVHALQTIVQVVVVVAGFYLVAAGEITMGALIAATILSGRALAPLAQISMLLARFSQTRLAYQMLSDIVSAPQERPPGHNFITTMQFQGELNFEKVKFGYDESREPALDDFNISISAGERVAFLGGIGSGKTTALKLANGLYLPQSGRVLIDGISITQIDPAILRDNVGLLLQHAELFHGTIRENIVMGRIGLSDDDVVRVVQQAGAMPWVSRLPKGLDTAISERGQGLSGGQRQSIALARILARDPRILLLDEPTSHMDQLTEQLVIKALEEEHSDKTLIVVTHRPALLKLVDRVVLIKNGRVIDDDAKAEVLNRLQTRRQAHKKREEGNDHSLNTGAVDST